MTVFWDVVPFSMAWQIFSGVSEALAASIIKAVSQHYENLKSHLVFVVIKLILYTVI
jgi:hypothetical protein